MKVQCTFGDWKPGDPWRRLYTFETPDGVDEVEPGDQFRAHGARVTVVEVGSDYEGEVATLDEKIEPEPIEGVRADVEKAG